MPKIGYETKVQLGLQGRLKARFAKLAKVKAHRSTSGGASGRGKKRRSHLTAVLDASALLAYLQDEAGATAVEAVLSESVISSVNWSEVLQKSR